MPSKGRSTDDQDAPGGPEVPENIDLEYLRAHPSAALPPSPLSSVTFSSMPPRPRAPTPSTLPVDEPWSPDYDQQFDSVSPSSAYIVDSPSAPLDSPQATVIPRQKFISRSASEEESFFSDSGYAQSLARSPTMPALPDPSQYPDPYPYRPSRWNTATPALSSTDSSSASTRSSGYTNTSSAKSGDYGHVHVALGMDEPGVGVGITTDDVVQLLAHDAGISSSSAKQNRAPVDQTRWSDFYSSGNRSRSSSVVTRGMDVAQDDGSPALRGTPSFDTAWQSVDERDEVGLTSEDETDDDALIYEEEDSDEKHEPTSAMMVAEEGRGVIVRGENGPIVQLQVKPGTTHLLLGSSTTPNAVPSFLTNNVPHITTTLLALDISANFLVALPPALSSCVCLEELNIASNPLRALPVFLSGLTSLRVLIADSTGLTTLPAPLSALEQLHTLSVRRNKMNSLPSWLCLLPSLETLLVDGNPFQGPWNALVEPLLAKNPMSPLYPLSTPTFPPPSASCQSTLTETDVEDFTDSPFPQLSPAVPEEDTITPARAPLLSRSATSVPGQSAEAPQLGLTRTRTTPNRAYHEKVRASKSMHGSSREPANASTSKEMDDAQLRDREVRKMKSAGELRPKHSASVPPPPGSLATTPQRPALSHYAASASSSNLLSIGSPPRDAQMVPKRFASLGVASGAMSPGRSRPPADPTIWDNISGDEGEGKDRSAPLPPAKDLSPRPPNHSPPSKYDRGSQYAQDVPQKDKSTRWGFLKKMSMGKMRSDTVSSRPSTAQGRSQSRPGTSSGYAPTLSPDEYRLSSTPLIDVRISTTGALLNAAAGQEARLSGLYRKPSKDMLKDAQLPPIPGASDSPPSDTSKVQTLSPPQLLIPPTTTSRANKRRSFLPIDMSPIPIPAASSFIPGVTATNEEADENESARATPSPIPIETSEQIQRREAEKAREARTRALRSVMAYLKDMHDLGLIQQSNPTSMYGATLEASPGGLRSRRPTVVENGRVVSSEGSTSSIASSSMIRPDSSHLRSTESRTGIRSGISTQTNSVATTDSCGSGEERKYKDDKGKRARIVREIVETERTYVKGLQELVDIYIRPAAVPANVLGGVGQGKDTVVPAAERKIVFSGLESLFSFHKESFLPALERVTAPLMRPTAEIAQADEDGRMSLDVARAVAHTIVSHAAFMRMYSTYINNFDNSLQRVKEWVSDRPTAPGSTQTLSPSSSTAQLAGLAMSMSIVSTAGSLPDMMSLNSNVTPLTSSQRKRIKAYLKRCRMNPRHSQLNLEGYLLLPVQRIPRYRLLLEELVRSSPPVETYMEDPLERALAEISSLATNMNEGKRESESRRKLVQWQSRIRGKFPSPLVQPHRRLIMDGPLHLTRVVRKAAVQFEVIDSKGDASTVQVECLSPELTPRALVGVLCNDLLVLCRDPSEGQDPHSQVDLWAVLRMQTLPQPASIVHGNALRLVDNKAILYFDAPSTSDALNWFRAINLHIPASKA